MGVVNLASTHSAQCGERYFLKSKIRDLLLDKSNLEFDGNQTVVVHTPEPLKTQRYTRNGRFRYGDLENVTDTVQSFKLSYEWAFNGAFDAGDMSDSKAYQKMCHTQLKMQQDEEITPNIDRMALYEIAHHAGTIASCASSAFTKDKVFELISSAETAVFNATKSSEGLTLVISASNYHILRMCPQFEFSDKLGTDAIEKGYVGTICNCKVQKLPDDYMPNHVFFMIIKKDAAFAHEKIASAKVFNNIPDIDGTLLQGHYYCGAFVRQEKCGGVYVLADSSYVSSAPSLSKSGTAVTCSAAGSGNQILYTVDGSDPRYSSTAQVYSAAVSCTSGDVFKAVIMPIIPTNQLPQEIMASELKFASSVAEITV